MKLSNLLLFAGSALGSYLLTKNRETITEEVSDTSSRIESIKDDLDIIQNSLEVINQQKEQIKEYQKGFDLQVQSLGKRYPNKTHCTKRNAGRKSIRQRKSPSFLISS